MRPERWWFTAPLRLKSIFRRRLAEQELDEELRFHLEQKIEEGIAVIPIPSAIVTTTNAVNPGVRLRLRIA